LVMLTNEPVKDLLESRYKKFRNMGQYFDFG
jgi:acetyl-CoA carboxylase alpha subunit